METTIRVAFYRRTECIEQTEVERKHLPRHADNLAKAQDAPVHSYIIDEHGEPKRYIGIHYPNGVTGIDEKYYMLKGNNYERIDDMRKKVAIYRRRTTQNLSAQQNIVCNK